IGLFLLSSIPVDKAEPSESLKANTVWSTGLGDALVLLSSNQLDAFRSGLGVMPERDVRAARGAYFLQAEIALAPAGEKTWYFAADLNLDHRQLEALYARLEAGGLSGEDLEAEIARDTARLTQKIAQADGCQATADRLNVFRHFSNTLFNILRGGIFDNGYWVDKKDFLRFLNTANHQLAQQYEPFLEALPEQVSLPELSALLGETDPHLERLGSQYLPLKFSRRHGDPSRPWNQFSIELKDADGGKKLDYQGNWRDIFQNWEALALSYPGYLEHMIARFLSASTADGYNPYRLIRDGFDWEIIDPADPWSHIGYWGDHQIIYLLKLLELSQKYHPGRLAELLGKPIYTYANVPYRIKPYRDLVKNPHETIDFDAELNQRIEARVAAMGSDGKYVQRSGGEIYRVNLLEKMLVPVLVKLSNFVPEAGIWMNTQRPEWNDANNALVGYGASMVTLCYLRRFFRFALDFLESHTGLQVAVSREVLGFLEDLKAVLTRHQAKLEGPFGDSDRKGFLDEVGEAGSQYRLKVYQKGFSGEQGPLAVADLIAFFSLAMRYVDHSIAANQRQDHLFHAYNLIDLGQPDRIAIRRLYEMLEGQVAVLSSGYLSAEASLALLGALRRSALYREDQSSYLLYPDRELTRFADKNKVTAAHLSSAGLSPEASVFQNGRILVPGPAGTWHFRGDLRNGRLLKEALQAEKSRGLAIGESEQAAILKLYEQVFDHQSFTGRSGTFYKYEGLGSIYWHMVSKLLLAAQETFFRGIESGAPETVLAKLREAYYDIRRGLGIHKSPDRYGAFTTDAYSHTPGQSGVQQPGMTGQVKEDILSRMGEFGVQVRDSRITFAPYLLDREELLSTVRNFKYYDVHNKSQTLTLGPGSLAFTICQVPVVYQSAGENAVMVHLADGRELRMKGLTVDSALSQDIFRRTGNITKVRVLLDFQSL
nr:hypothetical protein [Calditrichia bacterium]